MLGMSPKTSPHLSFINAPSWFAFCSSGHTAQYHFLKTSLISWVGWLAMVVAIGRHYVFLLALYHIIQAMSFLLAVDHCHLPSSLLSLL